MVKIQKSKIAIIGAGISGCFLAISLAQKGFNVEIFENLSKEDIINAASKKSFNLTFYGYAIKALKEIGLWEEIRSRALPLGGSITRINANSPEILSSFDSKKLPYYTISRAEFLNILIEIAQENQKIKFFFETGVKSVNRHNKTILISQKGKKLVELQHDVIFGADGVNSMLRGIIQQGQAGLHHQEYLPWTYKQVRLSAKSVAILSLKPNFMYVSSCKDSLFIAFPQKDGSFSCMLILPLKKPYSHTNLTTPEKIKNFLSRKFSFLNPVREEVIQSLLNNPESRFTIIHTSPWYYKGNLVLLGDSAHGFYPFFGMGVTAALGDCLSIIKLISKYGPSWDKIFPLYEESRKRHMDCLGDLSKQGFYRYLRHQKADYNAIYEKLELILHKLIPGIILPPIFITVAMQPDQTADLYQKYQNQRKALRFLLFPVLVFVITSIVSFFEKVFSPKFGS